MHTFYCRMQVSQLCSPSCQLDELRGRVPRKALGILGALSQNNGQSTKQKHNQIAESVKCSNRYVRKVLSGHVKQASQVVEQGAPLKSKWYENIARTTISLQ